MRHMVTRLTLVATAAMLCPAFARAQAVVRIDSTHHTVTLTAGPWDIPAPPKGATGEHAGHSEPPTERFVWPVSGWLRGARLEIIGANGAALPRDIVHHIEVVNFGRRELFYPAAERLVGFGKETEDLRLPATIGVPVTAGMPMAVAIAWHNATAAALPGVRLQLTFEWLPTNFNPRPVSVLPVTLVVSHDIFEESGWDLPAGPSSWTRDFPAALSGRILAAGGHLHDYARNLELVDVPAAGEPRQVLALAVKQGPSGQILSLQRLLPGVMGDGIRMHEGHTYRIVGTYQNPTGKTIEGGAMTHLVVLFAPDKLAAWPAVVASDPGWQKDQDYLFHRTMAGMDMPGMEKH
ncbi:MAG TPA: hypothetical protein VHW65_06425 [Gemmatimonadales bacterium]|jgi:hypothetical protein|nr:hypothetical protein [Gemmatimonadales bacterium]